MFLSKHDRISSSFVWWEWNFLARLDTSSCCGTIYISVHLPFQQFNTSDIRSDELINVITYQWSLLFNEFSLDCQTIIRVLHQARIELTRKSDSLRKCSTFSNPVQLPSVEILIRMESQLYFIVEFSYTTNLPSLNFHIGNICWQHCWSSNDDSSQSFKLILVKLFLFAKLISVFGYAVFVFKQRSCRYCCMDALHGR